MTDTWVYTDKEHGWVNVDDTEFLDIEESPYGDVMHFAYKGVDYSSKIVIGSKPG
jgi:hypothetical protein